MKNPFRIKIEKEDSPYWEAFCFKCFWQGMSVDCNGFGSIADTGDYEDGYCPVCGNDIDEHNSKYYNLWFLFLHFTLGKLKSFIYIKKIDRQNKKEAEYWDNLAKERGWY